MTPVKGILSGEPFVSDDSSMR